MEGLIQGDRIVYGGVKLGEFMYYAKTKRYDRRAVVFFDGNKKYSNVLADKLARTKKEGPWVSKP